MARRTIALLGLLSALSPPCLLASAAVAADEAGRATLGQGEVLPGFTLPDQHGEERSVDASTRMVLFSRDMDGGDLLKSGLGDLPEGFLVAHGVAYVSDISGMPRLVARLFALPAMRRRPYPMLLDRDGSVTAMLPDEPRHATLIRLDALRITSVEHVSTGEEVLIAVEALPLLGEGDDESDGEREGRGEVEPVPGAARETAP